ncbi:hypothetical protein [Micromonospora sp. AMSO31t]|uniref:hypothetical protein n=1 Tax=Micromonospora sp. AMSO31t TaxID=2650566 RepID=UPI00124AE711|nr:hypothetical protein [Micromonospora sp. AMSO31t]KAB1912088.1 hypothetical protein F8274_14945 [Micromonospora sp. AMSO31t]
MNRLVSRSLCALAGAGLAVVAAAPPAAAADSTFDLAAGGASAYGTYQLMMSIPEQPVPPVAVDGTLAVNQRHRCAVVQIATNGPADGLEWRTLNSLCGRSKTNVQARASYLWGGFLPSLRLCTGRTVAQAERGDRCDVHVPPSQS